MVIAALCSEFKEMKDPMLSRPTHPLLLDESSHVIALVSCSSLHPSKPEGSALFERAAELQSRTGCDVSIAHVAKPAGTEQNLKEHLTLRVLVKRINENFDSDFDVVIRYGAGNCDDVRRLVTERGGDLLLVDYADSETLEVGKRLVEHGSFPLWYVAKPGEIEEVSARLNNVEGAEASDQLTVNLANHLGENFGTRVNYLHSELNAINVGDLVVTCAKGVSEYAGDKSGREMVRQLLETTPDFDLLVHRGTRCETLSDAA
ncbi:MAG: hypothetical protein ACI8Z1_001938 [Candidatus Azotimanducaceae bacterium]|jgi:hypothetical protein